MRKITALEVQKRNKERVNVFLDSEYAFSLSLMEAAKLRKGQELSPHEISSLQADDEVHRAVESAVRFLANRPRSESEIRQNLQKKTFDDRVIDAALQRLRNLGYLDDEAFARYWIENRETFKPHGPMALRFELRQKGIADSVIDSTLETLDVFDSAYRAAHKRASRYQGKDARTFENKIGSFLQRRGFTYEVIRNVIEKLSEELVEADPDFFSQSEE